MDYFEKLSIQQHETNTAMNILYHLHKFPKLSESFVINEIHSLIEAGHEVVVFALERPDEVVQHDELNEMDLAVGYADGVISRTTAPFVPGDPNKFLSDVRAHPGRALVSLPRAWQCVAFIERLDLEIDLIHSHFATSPALSAQYAATQLDVPCTITSHASDLYSAANASIAERTLRGADRIFTISEYNKEYINRELGVTTPTKVVHAGIRPEKFEPTDETVPGRILSVARFVEKKGLRYALKAINQVVDRHPQLDFHLIGSGPLESEFRDLIERNELKEHVTLLDSVSDERLITEYDEAEVFVLPCVVSDDGDRDGIPVVLMEAMAMRTVPVTTPVSGIPELVSDDENGILVRPHDSREISDALNRLLDESNTRQQLSHNARRTVERGFDVRVETRKLVEHFEEVSSDTKSGGDRPKHGQRYGDEAR